MVQKTGTGTSPSCVFLELADAGLGACPRFLNHAVRRNLPVHRDQTRLPGLLTVPPGPKRKRGRGRQSESTPA